MATHPNILAWEIPMVRGAWRATVHGVGQESDATESLNTTTKGMGDLPPFSGL